MARRRCGLCGEVFSSRAKREIHKEKVHRDKGKFKCGECDESFPSKSARLRHKKEVHGGYFKKNKEEIPMEKAEKEVYLEEEPKVERKSPIQKVDKIVIPEKQAKEEWKKYVQLLKKRKDKHLEVLRQSMYYAKQGKALIDVYAVIKKAGLNSKNEPRLAVARADIKKVVFEKRDTGTGRFLMGTEWKRKDWKTDVELPQKTFKVGWERLTKPDGTPSWGLKDKELTAKVPVIPADLMPEGELKDYYILWEVKEWEQLPEVKDPFLLKRISENLFVILGAWDLTELERSVIAGR